MSLRRMVIPLQTVARHERCASTLVQGRRHFIRHEERPTPVTHARHASSLGGKGTKGSSEVCPKCGESFLENFLERSPRYAKCPSCEYFSVISLDEHHNTKVESSHPEHKQAKKEPLPTPKQINEYLNEYVIGQARAKKVLSVGLYNHYKRIAVNAQYNKASLNGISGVSKMDKTNVLLLGPTGTGKTLLAQTLSRCLDVPMTICDCTSLTQAGYVGEDVESIIAKLLIAAEFDVEKCQKGIVFLDEVDKISLRSKDSGIRDVSGEGVQQGLLKLLEGTTVNIPERLIPSRKLRSEVQIDTTNILFIASGAFSGIEKIIRDRKVKKSIGFGSAVTVSSTLDGNKDSELDQKLAQADKFLQEVEEEDMIQFGIIPEFVGRLAQLVPLSSLDRESLVQILSQPKNSIVKQYKYLFSLDKCELVFTENGLNAIAQLAIRKRTGARGLRSIIESILIDTMYEVPGSDIEKVIVNSDTVLNKTPPVYVHRPKEVETVRPAEMLAK